MVNNLLIDVYKHLKEDTGLIGTGGPALDPSESRTLRTMIGCSVADFPLHVMAARQYPKIEDYLPVIQFSAAKTGRVYRDVFRTSLEFIVFSHDPTLQELATLVRRIVALFHGKKAGKFLFNACPLQGRYVNPYMLIKEYAPVPTEIEGVYCQMLSFAGMADEMIDMLGRPL